MTQYLLQTIVAVLSILFLVSPDVSAKCQELKPHRTLNGNQVRHGKFVFCHDSDTTWLVQHYRNGKVHGVERSWHENGMKAGVTHWRNGEEHGRDELWYDNGVKMYSGEKRNGKRVGTHRWWHKNGQKKSVCAWTTSATRTTCTEWYEDGSKESEMERMNNQFHGMQTGWHRNGRKRYQSTRKHNKYHGESFSWSADGLLTSYRVYENGVKLLETTKTYKETAAYTKRLARDRFATPTLNDYRVASTETLHQNGRQTETYDASMRSIQLIKYNSDDTKILEAITTYKGDTRFTTMSSWRSDGTPHITASLKGKAKVGGLKPFDAKEQHGTVKLYSDTGKLLKTTEWIEGVQITSCDIRDDIPYRCCDVKDAKRVESSCRAAP